jgi:UDP:flavonoid glycosyltransferase YjiC (YdhE family)
LKARGHAVRFLQRDTSAGADLEGAAAIPREGAPIWAGPLQLENPLNFGEILCNFGYQSPATLRPLVDAWRERLKNTQLVVANVAPAAHLAALTLGIPSLEISQGFHVPPPTLPAPPLRDWEPAPRSRLEAADHRVLDAMNQVLAAHGAASLSTLGDLFVGRALLLTYPELDIYPQRGPADYYGVPESAEGSLRPAWPDGSGPRVLAYVYNYYPRLRPLIEALEQSNAPTLMMCRGIDRSLLQPEPGCVFVAEEPMSFARLLPECDLVVCHASHQTTAQALLAGKPVLLLPTQLEQFLITRRVVRQGMGLGIEAGSQEPDFCAGLRQLGADSDYARRANDFAARYRGHDRAAALATMVKRCESLL